VKKHYPLLINNSTAVMDKITVTSPYNGTTLSTFDACDEINADRALETAHKLFTDRKQWLSVEQRIKILKKTALIMQQRRQTLALDASHEGGKPLIDSEIEVERAIDGIIACIECLRTHAGTSIPMSLNAASTHKLAFTQFEPIGPVIAISAFNHPLNLIVHQIAPAIAAGNPVIVKPAEDTPISCYEFISILYEAGLPEPWCQALVVKDVKIATKLVTDQRVAFFSFIGSAKVGWLLRSQLAAGTRCTLEHGGAAAVIIDQTADVKQAIPKLIKGGYYHSGQVCVSVQRIFCHDSIIETVKEQLKKSIASLVVGDPTDPKTDCGPLIRHREVERVHNWVSEAITSGATLICGGKAISASCYQPTLLLNPPQDCKVSQLEIFGPVVCLYSYKEIDQAISLANSLPFSFQASIFSQNINHALSISKQLNASTVMVNEHTAFRVDWMPFAGLKQSGLGVGGIPHTFKEMQIEKMTIIHSNDI